MNKIFILALAIFLGLCACESKQEKSQDDIIKGNNNFQAQTKVKEEKPLKIDLDAKKNNNDISGATVVAEPECSKPSDCVLIPTKTCLGCIKGGAQAAVTKEEAKKIMAQKQECQEEVKSFMQKKPENINPSTDASCQFNDADCVEGKCQLVKRSEEEMKQKMEKMKASMPKGPQGEGREDEMMPQGPSEDNGPSNRMRRPGFMERRKEGYGPGRDY